MSFVPRSVARGREEMYGSGRGGGRGARGGSRGSRGRGNFIGRGRGMRGHGAPRGRDRGMNTYYANTFKPIKHDKGPVKILHPDDPDHPNFLKDGRNKDKIEQLIAEGRLDSDTARVAQSDHDECRGENVSDDDQLYPEKILLKSEGNLNDDKFSDEGLRITVENKGTELAVADPSFYDEIQPRESNMSTRTRSKTKSPKTQQSAVDEKMEYENISESDEAVSPPRKKRLNQEAQHAKEASLSKHAKQSSESILITVGNDKFNSRDSSTKSNLDFGKKRRESPVRHHHPPRPLTEYGLKKAVQRHRSQSRSPKRPISKRSRSRSRSRSHNRSLNRSRRRSQSRSYRRSRSRSYRRSRSRSHRRSTSRNRRRSSSRSRRRLRSRSHNRSYSRSRSLSRVTGRNTRSGSSSYDGHSTSSSTDRDTRSRRNGSEDRSPRANLPPKSKWEDSPQRSSRWDDSPPMKNSTRNPDRAATGSARSKVNPFMDYLKDLDYSKLSGEKTAGDTLPWMQDASKAKDVLEIEKYLENKLKQAKVEDQRKKEFSAASKSPAIQEQGESPQPGSSYRQPENEHVGACPKEYTSKVQKPRVDPCVASPRAQQKMKEPSPTEDLYDDLPSQLNLAPVPTKVINIKSILKQTGREPSPRELHTEIKPSLISSQSKCVTEGNVESNSVPGIASIMDIDDEDAFLYGDIDISQAKAAALQQQQQQQQQQQEEHDDEDSQAEPVFTGGYRGADPGWEVAPSKVWTEPIESTEPTKKDDPPVDPTIQNILKSIGFNFELSKLMQKKAQDERKKGEDIESYGIRQGSSFLGGGLKSSDIKSALKLESTDVGKKGNEGKKTVDIKESYEERARRYREEQMKIYQGVPDSELNEPEQHWDNSQEGTYYDNNQSEEMDSHSGYNQPDTNQYDDHGYNQEYSHYEEHAAYQQGYHQGFSEPIRQSNLTVIQTVDSDQEPRKDIEEIRLSALQQLQDVYHEDERLRELKNYKHGLNHPERMSSRDSWDRDNDWERTIKDENRMKPFDDDQDTCARVSEKDYFVEHQRQASSDDPADLYRKERKTSYGRNKKDIVGKNIKDYHKVDLEEHRRKERESSYDQAFKRDTRDNSCERARRGTSRSRGRSSDQSPSYEMKSKRAITPPRRESSISREENASGRKMEKPPGSQKKSDPDADKSSSMNSKEREHLMYELDDRLTRMKALEKELIRLKRQENELMRKQQRQKKGDKDKLLDKNILLQKEITQQMSLLKNAAEVNAQLLLTSRTGDVNEDQELMALIMGQKSKKKMKKSRTVSPEPPPRMKRNKSPPPEKKSSDKKTSSFIKPAEEKIKLKKMEVHYEYFDPGNHWCKQCNNVSSNCYEVFQHLQSKKHMQKLDPYERPWMPESLKNPTKPSVKGQSVAAPLKGVEFIMAVQAFYCSLCKEFSGDMICAEDHLKSVAHNEKYQRFLDDNQFYERRYNLDKAAGLSMASTISSTKSDDAETDQSYNNETSLSTKTMDEAERATKLSRRRESERLIMENLKRRKEEGERLKRQYEKETKKIHERAEASKKDALQKNKILADKRQLQDKNVAELDDVDHSNSKAESKAKPFGNFKWKGKAPIIGKAPGFKKAAAATAAAETDATKSSIKLSGKMFGSKNTAGKVDVGKPIPTLSKWQPKKTVKLKDEGPDPLDIFVTVSSSSSSTTNSNLVGASTVELSSSIKKMTDIELPALPPPKQPVLKSVIPPVICSKPEVAKTVPMKVLKMSKEEQEERKLLGIEEEVGPQVAPRPPPPMALGISKPEQSMAATSAKNIYDVFFGNAGNATATEDKAANETRECSDDRNAAAAMTQ